MDKLRLACDFLTDAIVQSDEERLYLYIWGEGYAFDDAPYIDPHTLEEVLRKVKEEAIPKIKSLGYGEGVTVMGPTGRTELKTVVRIR